MADVSSPALYPHLPLHGLVGRAIPRTSLKPRRQRPPLAMSRPYRPRSTPRFFEASSAVIPNGPPHSCFVPIIVVISSRTFWPHPPLCVLDGGFTCIVLRNSAFLSSERNVRVIALSRLQVEVVLVNVPTKVTGGTCAVWPFWVAGFRFWVQVTPTQPSVGVFDHSRTEKSNPRVAREHFQGNKNIRERAEQPNRAFDDVM